MFIKKYIIHKLLLFIELPRKIRSKLQKRLFSSVGDNVSLGYNSEFIYRNISLGNNVHIGSNCSIMSSISKVYIEDYVTIGPNVTIRGGDHRIDLLGKYIFEVKEEEKLTENDKDVRIETGVWIGCNVTILKGVVVGRGSVVAAGSVVTKNIIPYSIVAGNPAKVIKMRFTKEEILEHELLLDGRRK